MSNGGRTVSKCDSSNKTCVQSGATGGIKTHYLHEPFEFYYLENFLAEFCHNK